jgi:hypothetical protein
MRLLVIGMDLDRQLLAGEQIFDEEVGRGIARRLEPDLADRIAVLRGIGEARPQVVAAPGLLDAVGGKQGGGHGQFPPK